MSVGSIPASELAYTDKDHADQQRLKNLLDRLGKAIIVSVEGETSEIIRRRLFEWDERHGAPAAAGPPECASPRPAAVLRC